MRPPARLPVSIFLIGFTATIAQVVTMRELMVVFGGNELSLGLMLAVWLLATAAGSAALGRIPVPALQLLTAAALPGAVLAIRAARTLMQKSPGELLGPAPMLVTSLAALGLLCAFSGGLFASASRIQKAASVYLLEAAGAGVGGALASLLLIRYLGSFEIVLGLAALNIAAAVGRPAFLALLVLVPAAGPRLETLSLAWLWHGLHLVSSQNSVYGNLALIQNEGSRTLYVNGLAAVTLPDPESAEESVHFALLAHPEPRRVLLIGGGVNGGAAEALKHPSVTKLDYVELDPAILRLFPIPPGVVTHPVDGRRYVKTTRQFYDVIALNLPDPQTAQINRFYTEEFFGEAKRRLAPGGVLALRLTGAENYVSPELRRLLQSVSAALKTHFAHLVAIPGSTVHLLASDRPLPETAEVFLARLRRRHIETAYVREYYLPFRMMPARMRAFADQIQPRGGTAANRDFAPVAYAFAVERWYAQFGWARPAISIPVILIGALLLLAPWHPARTGAAAMGFTLMGLEMMLLLGFQAAYGYVYHQLAVLTAGFMVGMALGSWAGLRAAPGFGRLAAIQGAGVLLPVVVLAGLPHFNPSAFAVAAVICGAAGGYQFAIASRMAPRPGLLYAVDLAGACAGALLIGTYLIPTLGFLKTAGLMALVNAVPAARALWPARTSLAIE